MAVPQALDFKIEFVDGTHIDVSAVGVAVDGDELLFFNQWSSKGGLPLHGNRVRRDRVVAVTTTATPGTGKWSVGFPSR